MAEDKRIVVLADPHCGHQYGLTPPEWQLKPDVDDRRVKGVAALEAAAWNEYVTLAASPGWHKPHILVCIGDSIDGDGRLSGGTELLPVDRRLQVHMAVRCIELWDAEQVLLLHGTAYHTGDREDWDSILCDLLKGRGVNAQVHSRAWVRVEPSGKRFHFRHHVGGSSIPHGRHTAPAREVVWLKLWSHDHGWPTSDVAWFGHVHYYTVSAQAKGMAVTSPALQLWTKFGARRCSGTVDWGVAQAHVSASGLIAMDEHLVDFVGGQPEEIVI